MKSCENDHEKIMFEGHNCPLCTLQIEFAQYRHSQGNMNSGARTKLEIEKKKYLKLKARIGQKMNEMKKLMSEIESEDGRDKFEQERISDEHNVS